MAEVAEFRSVVDAHKERVYHAALRILGNRDEALDASQDAFLSLHLHRASVSADGVGRWLERVATNAAIDRVRRRRRETVQEPPEREAPDTGPFAVAADTEERQLLRDALKYLPERQRQVVTLRVVDQMTFAEIQKALGISDGAAKTHFRRGVQALTARLASHSAKDQP